MHAAVDFPIFPFPPLFQPKVFGGILETNTTPPQYALVRGRYTGKWSFPKGHKEANETPFITATREVIEETGIDDLPPPAKPTPQRYGYGVYFHFQFDTPPALDPKDRQEITEWAWVTIEQMENLPINIDVNKFRKATLFRMANPHRA